MGAVRRLSSRRFGPSLFLRTQLAMHFAVLKMKYHVCSFENLERQLLESVLQGALESSVYYSHTGNGMAFLESLNICQNCENFVLISSSSSTQ